MCLISASWRQKCCFNSGKVGGLLFIIIIFFNARHKPLIMYFIIKHNKVLSFTRALIIQAVDWLVLLCKFFAFSHTIFMLKMQKPETVRMSAVTLNSYSCDGKYQVSARQSNVMWLNDCIACISLMLRRCRLVLYT